MKITTTPGTWPGVVGYGASIYIDALWKRITLATMLGAARFEKYFTTRTQRLPVRYFGRDINDEKLTVLIKDRGHSSSSVKSMSSHKRDTAAPGSIGSSIVPSAVE